MGEAQSTSFQPEFNRAVKIEFDDQRITSHAGVVLLREADHRLGLGEALAGQLVDPRRQDRIRYSLVELLRERLYAMASGAAAQDDVDRLAHDPAFRLAVWDRPGDAVLDERLASQPTQSRLLDILARQPGNLNALRESLFESVHRHLRASGQDHAAMRGTIDLDSFPIQVHGRQRGGRYNGHYQITAYHPLVASFSVGGDYDSARAGQRLGSGFIHAVLRQGSVHTAHGARRFIRNVVKKARCLARSIDFRMDAGYTLGAIMDALCDDDLRFVGRLRGNARLDALAAPHLTRPVGRPPCEGYEFTVELGDYQADAWRHAQRLILVVVDRPDPLTGQLEMFPKHFFLVTNWSQEQRSADALLAHYRPRGTFEDRLGEFNQAIGAHLSSPEFQDNEATMLLAMLAYNLASIARVELEDATGGCWDLGRFQSYVLNAAGRVTKGARRLTMHTALSVRHLWDRLWKRIAGWRLPARFGRLRGPRSRPWMPPPRHAHRSEVLRA
jgi:hypothetical protein